MGKTLMGSTQQTGTVDLLTPQQRNYLSNVLGETSSLAGDAYSQFLQPYSPEQYEDVFQKAILDPTLQAYQQQVLPSIQQRFVDANAASSSALNQALAQSAENLGTSLGSEYGRFFQGQQGRTLEALGQLGGLTGRSSFQPIVQQKGGILNSLLSSIGQLGGALMPSGIFRGF